METGRNHVSPSRKAPDWRGDDRPTPIYGGGDRTKRPGVGGNFHLSPVAKGRLRPQGVGDRVDVSGPEPDKMRGIGSMKPIAPPSMLVRRGGGSHVQYRSSMSVPTSAEQRQGAGVHKPAGGEK
jgi:hypothetical protein